MILYFYDYDIVNMNYEWRQSCQQCSGWMYDLNHESLQYTPEKDYPIHLFPDNIINNKLKPTMITKSNIEKQINDLLNYLKENQITIGKTGRIKRTILTFTNRYNLPPIIIISY